MSIRGDIRKVARVRKLLPSQQAAAIRSAQKFMLDDPSSHIGAEALAYTITEYWRERGGIINCRLERMVSCTNQTFVCVRSDMLNGRPIQEVIQ